MPHCIIEYSNNLENEIVSSTIQNINEVLVTSNLKVRALPFSIYLIGGKAEPFVHITLKLLT